MTNGEISLHVSRGILLIRKLSQELTFFHEATARIATSGVVLWVLSWLIRRYLCTMCTEYWLFLLFCTVLYMYIHKKVRTIGNGDDQQIEEHGCHV